MLRIVGLMVTAAAVVACTGMSHPGFSAHFVSCVTPVGRH